MTAEPAPDAAAVGAFRAALARGGVEFAEDASLAGVDVLAPGTIGAVANRARLKLFTPQRGVAVVFLYKASQVPFSDDRYAYGAIIAKNRALDPAELDAVVAWALTGFHPEKRPPGLRRAFPYDVPR